LQDLIKRTPPPALSTAGWFHLLKEHSVTLILVGGRGILIAMPLQNAAIFDIF
jgi:hypothetical protein